jgi:hypothetical protein
MGYGGRSMKLFRYGLIACSLIIFLMIGMAITAFAEDGSISYAQWKDPLEQAFTLDVPRGWAIEGGMYRNDAMDERQYARAVSPDGRIIVNIFDPRVARNYIEPTSPLAIVSGASEGSMINQGITKNPVLRFLSGVQYAELYLNSYPEEGSTGVTILSRKDYGPNENDNWGRLTYSCYRNGEDECRGAVTAHTKRTDYVWFLMSLSSYLAPQSKEALALSVCERMRQSWKWNDAWLSSDQKKQQALLKQRDGGSSFIGIPAAPSSSSSSVSSAYDSGSSSYDSGSYGETPIVTDHNACQICLKTCCLRLGHYGMHQCPEGHTWL